MIMLAKQYIKGFIYQEDRSYKQTKKTDKHKIHIEARPDYKATQSSQNTITTWRHCRMTSLEYDVTKHGVTTIDILL